MFRSIRGRIAIPYITLALLTMVGMTVYLSGFIRQAYLDGLRHQLTNEATLLSEIVLPLLTTADRAASLDALAQRSDEQLEARVTIIALDGVVIADSQRPAAGMENHGTRIEVLQAMTSGRGFSVRRSDTLDRVMMYAAVRAGAAGGPSAVVRLAVPLTAVDARIADLNKTLLGATLGALILIAALAVLVAERTSRPVRQLTQAVEQMARGDLTIRSLPTTRDEVGRLAGVFNDMADAFQNQMAAVTDQRNKLETVLTHMTDGAIITDPEGRVQLINPAAERLLGIAEQDAAGESLTTAARDHHIVAIWQRSRQTGKEQSDVVEIVGRGPFLRVVATPLQSPSAGGSLLILQDLTQVRRLETIRRDFISNISHELRNPLAALKALVDTLRDGALDDRPMAERFLTQMDGEVDAMTNMVRELLELSRIESGKVPLRLSPTAVADLVTPAAERLRPQAERAGLSLAVNLPQDLPSVMADSERLQQVLNNLIHNAIKFTPPGGRITVTARTGNKVTIAVSDTGVGIAADDLTRIFERFYKADRARSGGGTGLGLAIAKHIVQAHGGQIWAESTPGLGATFSFTLPVAGIR
jgi:two-component system phosphate regulon sensor histidine kinase PhoR